MATKYPELFEPTRIGKLELKNKMSMAPMGPVGYGDENAAFNQRLQDYYVERAKGGIGLIITGICSVDLSIEGIPDSGLPSPTKNPIAFVHAATQMNERIHAYGTKIFLQLTGGLGRSAIPGFTKKNIAPSKQENRFDPRIEHREMTIEEIHFTIKQFVTSAVIAKQSGFDGVEIHAVHEGYLLDQFALEFFNHRKDEYGGSLENRLRISTEIVKGIKAACGPDFPVSLRYSLKSCMKGLRQGGLPGEEYVEVGRDIEEGIEAAKILTAAGYDALNVDAGTYDSWYWNHPPMYFEEGPYREFGAILKKEVDVPIILAGRMENPELAVNSLGVSCDILSYGRQLLTDPDYPEKVRTNRLDEIRPCLGCHEGCLGRISQGPVSCAVNPACGREKIYGLSPAPIKKKVYIIGGGVAGMEAARVTATQGHSVTLFEKSNSLGGNLIPGGMPHFKRYDHQLVEWYERQLELLDVNIQFNHKVTSEELTQSSVDTIIVATGSVPKKMLSFEETVTADDVLLGTVIAGERTVVIGGGLVGCETALWLAQQGKDVSIVEVAPSILATTKIPHMNEYMLEDLLEFHHVDIYTNAKVKDVKNKQVIIELENQTIQLDSDTTIAAIGYAENNQLFKDIRNASQQIFHIGDSRKVHNIMYAIWDAYEVARNI